jgi:hypothetical protein
MHDTVETLTVKVNDQGVILEHADGSILRLSATDALLLLDILEAEQARLKKLIRKKSPFVISR